MNQKPTQITVFTGFLGSGKTSIILNLIKNSKLNKERICVLKNEFGDNEIDSKLFELELQKVVEEEQDASQPAGTKSAIAIKEMLNGCMCCVLVGQMKNALLELKELNDPDRIIIETSGSAFPAPIAWQIRELDQSHFNLDSIITVVDCVNFKGYEDTSYTAKMQAQYTDLILLNKYELVSERDLDLVIDSVNDLNTDTPKLKWSIDCADASLLFNLSIRPFSSSLPDSSNGEETHPYLFDQNHHSREIDLIHISSTGQSLQSLVELEDFLSKLDKEYIYRVKGILAVARHDSSSLDKTKTTTTTGPTTLPTILNWAFGRGTLTPLVKNASHGLKDAEFEPIIRVTVMGIGLQRFLPLFENMFPGSLCSFKPRHLDQDSQYK